MSDKETPILSKSDRFFQEADKIQEHCACRRVNERECYRARYAIPMDDDFGERHDDEDAECGCACHVELGILEHDIWREEEL